MSDPAIHQFMQKRKEDWLSKKITPDMEAETLNELQAQAQTRFDLEHWLPDAANRACSRAMTTHPCKFSHPSTGIGKKNRLNGTYVTSIMAHKAYAADGFLKTGNAQGQIDSVGNAADLDVDEFLNLIMQDGKTLLNHIEADSELAKSLLTINSESYETLRKGFLAMAATDNTTMTTSTKIKQVYFPVDENGYHLLSVLSNSGLIYELRKRIDALRFAEEQKKARDLKRHNQISEHGFSEIYNITTIGYGGTKPQNISVLNNKNGGKARLLLSIPPHMQLRDVHFPKKDFFHSSIRFYDIAEPLKKLDMMFKTGLGCDLPRRHLEKSRDNRIEEILDIIIERMSAVRAVAEEQYHCTTSTLPLTQQIWLLKEHQQLRLEQDEWLDLLCTSITSWILAAYQKVINRKIIILGPAERAYINAVITTHREALR